MFWRLTAVGALLGLDLGFAFAIYIMGGVGEEGGDVFFFYGLIGFVLGLGAGAIAGSWDSTDEPAEDSTDERPARPRWLSTAMAGVVGLNLGLLLAVVPADRGVSADSLPIYLACATVGLVLGVVGGGLVLARRR